MNNNKLYKIIYYICSIITLILVYIVVKKTTGFGTSLTFDNAFIKSYSIISILLFIIFNILLIRKKEINNINIILPIIYIIFVIIVTTIMFQYNNILIEEYIHFDYYTSFVLFGYILLNIYSILSLESKKNNSK